MPGGLCKLLGDRRADRVRRLWSLGTLATACLAGCATPMHRVSADALERGEEIVPSGVRRAIVSDTGSLAALSSPLGPRVSLLEIRTRSEWEEFRSTAPEIGPAPDFSHGIVVGLVSHAGVPADGEWPIMLDSVLVHEGAGFAVGRFHGGSYLPDSTTYVEMAQVSGLKAVLMVDVNGTRFYAR